MTYLMRKRAALGAIALLAGMRLAAAQGMKEGAGAQDGAAGGSEMGVSSGPSHSSPGASEQRGGGMKGRSETTGSGGNMSRDQGAKESTGAKNEGAKSEGAKSDGAKSEGAKSEGAKSEGAKDRGQ